MKLLFVWASLAALVCLQALANPAQDDKILDCITNPCITVPGVGKLKGTKKVRSIFYIYKHCISIA
jgi:hypothetical protein